MVTAGFVLESPIQLAPDGQNGSEAYFRYYAETADLVGSVDAQINYYTTLEGNSGIIFFFNLAGNSCLAWRETLDLGRFYVVSVTWLLMFLSPLGVVAYVPNTGVVSSAIVPMFEQYFAEKSIGDAL